MRRSARPAPSGRPVAIVWQRFGPYHHARLRAAQRRLPAVGVEVSPVDPTYRWDRVEPGPGSKMLRLFEDRFSQDIAVAEVKRRVQELFSGLRPAAVAIAGWSDRAPLAALEWCVAQGVPAVLMSPSQRDDAPRVWHKEWVKRRIVGLFSAALVGGAPQKRYLEELGFPPERMFTGYNAVDNAHFSLGAAKARAAAPALRRALGLPADYFVVSARFVPKKNLEGFLRAYALYVKASPKRPWRLVLMGDGPGRAALEGLVGILGLRNFVGMHGFKQYNVLPQVYGLAGALALPSASEQWGLVVNEAMASGLPVLVSKACGCAEDLVADGVNGFLLDPGDAGQMASMLLAMAAAKGKQARAMGAQSRIRVDRWGPEAFAAGLRAALAAAADAPAPRTGLLDRALLNWVMRQNLKGYRDQ